MSETSILQCSNHGLPENLQVGLEEFSQGFFLFLKKKVIEKGVNRLEQEPLSWALVQALIAEEVTAYKVVSSPFPSNIFK
jgi:hypothetical protein